jgi:aryl sulfotransferase
MSALSEARIGWLVSYPRSGNTWLRFMLGSLIAEGADVSINAPGISTPVANREEFDALFAMDSGILTDEEIELVRPKMYGLLISRFQGPLILRKVHDRCRRNVAGERMFPPELSRGAVYIVRDPRDVAVSFAQFSGIPPDETIRRMGDPAQALPGLNGRVAQFPQPLGTWSEHVRSWLDQSRMPVHLVRYEDMGASPVQRLTEVADFLGIPSGAVDRAVAAARFEGLRAQEDESRFREFVGSGGRFFWQGRSGGWRSALSRAQAQRLEQDHGEVMSRLGYL